MEAIVCKNGKFAVMNILFTGVLSFQHFIFLITLQLKHIQQTAHSFQLCMLVNKLTGLTLHFWDLENKVVNCAHGLSAHCDNQDFFLVEVVTQMKF